MAVDVSNTNAPTVKASGMTSLPNTVKSAVAMFPASSITVRGSVPFQMLGTVILAVKAPVASVAKMGRVELIELK